MPVSQDTGIFCLPLTKKPFAPFNLFSFHYTLFIFFF